MRKQNFLLAAIVATITVFAACKRDETNLDKVPTVSRLYISNADVDPAMPNTTIFDPADVNPFPAPYQFDSQLPDGNGILFDPFSGTVFQAGREDRTIKTFTVNNDGSLTTKGSFTDADLLSAREIAFDRNKNILYVSSNTDSMIYVYEKASTLSKETDATRRLKLNGQPWGIHLDGDRLFVVIDQDRKEVQLLTNVSAIATGPVPNFTKITVTGATRLHGVTYSPAKKALILTEIGSADNNADGGIYIIEQADAAFAAGNAIAPTRTITGALTTMGNPVDVGIDDREGKDLVYIAEKANKKILVFNYLDNGNTAPAISQTLNTSPEAIYVDAR